MPPVVAYLITLCLSIPILSIFAGILKEWLNLRAKRATPTKARELEQKLEQLLDRAGLQLKTLEKSKQDLEEKVERLEITNAEYAERIENLEAVVVSQAWNALHNRSKASRNAEPDGVVVSTRPHDVSDPTPEEQNRRRAADLARRLGG